MGFWWRERYYKDERDVGRRQRYHNHRGYRKYYGLDDYIMQHLGYYPITATELKAKVCDDYGSVHHRVFYRKLERMRKLGVVRTEKLVRKVGWRLGEVWGYALQKQVLGKANARKSSRS